MIIMAKLSSLSAAISLLVEHKGVTHVSAYYGFELC